MQCFLSGGRCSPATLWSLLVGLAAAGIAPQAEAVESRVIYMVIQAEPETTDAEVKDKFAQAIKKIERCNVKDVFVEPIDPQTFTMLRGILQRGLDGARQQQSSGPSALIRPVVGADLGWSIDLGGPFEFIESVTLTLSRRARENGGEEQQVLVTGPGPNPDGYALRLHSPGRYVLTLPKDSNPRSIGFDVIVDDGQAEIRKRRVDHAWPSVGRAYLVTLMDVVGDESELFATLQDPAKVSNPIREIQGATNASLMVASFVEVLGNRLRIQHGQVTFSFPKPQEVNPKRLWLLFPLTAEDLNKEKKALEAVVAEPEGFMRLPEIIRANAANARLAPGRGAGWVELPLGSSGFTGVIDIDVAAWKSRLQSSPGTVGDNALLVYEFEDGPDTLRPLKMTDGYVVTDRIAEWLPALRSAE
jgi:hypothetical protein